MLHNAQYCIDGNVDLSLYGIPALWTDSQRIFSREYFAILITIGVIFKHIMQESCIYNSAAGGKICSVL